jgi:serine/threonine-protein kinase
MGSRKLLGGDDYDDEAPTQEIVELRSGIRPKPPDCPVGPFGIANDPEKTDEIPALDPRYELKEMIGAGGMGTVVAAIDKATGHEVALKLLRSDAPRTTNVRRLMREAETARRVDSTFVPRIQEMAVDGERPYLVMERLRGESLRDRLRRTSGWLPFADVIDIVAQLLQALEAVHEAGIVHRDVKPANVFLVGTNVKLIDFGLATSNSSDIRASSLNAFGTIDYLAPERLLERENTDHRVDIWATGITLHVALTGRHPFHRELWRDQLNATLLDEAPLVSALRSDVPRLVDDVIRMALAKEPEDRFASARTFRHALLAASGG